MVHACADGPYPPGDPGQVRKTRWDEHSVADPGGDFGYELTRVYIQLGEKDMSSAVAHGAAFFQEVHDAHEDNEIFPWARIDCIDEMPHGPGENFDIFYTNLTDAVTWVNGEPPSGRDIHRPRV